MKYSGVRWYKSDLHLHTPASRCFRDREVTAEQWVQRCIEQGLDVVAVTDHNTGAYIDRIKAASIGTSLTVFPGVEVTCGEAKVHMLIIFEKDKDTQFIEDFLVSIDINREDFSTENAFTPKNTIEVARKVKEKGGIIIPAHIDEYNGISNMSYTSRNELLLEENIDGVQVVHEVFLNDNRNEDIARVLSEYYGKTIEQSEYRNWKTSVKQATEHNKAILTFSDNPHALNDSKHGLWGIGRRYTWIKMDEEINLESLRQALLLPEHRIRSDFENTNHPYTLPDSWIKSLKVSNTELNQEELNISFNPQMTTIIGGRGTGKSSVVRFIRGVLNKVSDLKGLDNLKKDQEKFFKLKNNSEGVLNENSIIEVVVVRFSQQYKITCTNFKNNGIQEITFYRLNNTTNEFEEIEESNLLESFKVDIFSQKQIYEIAKNPNALRERIDTPINDITLNKIKLISLKKEYIEQSAKIRRIESEIDKKSKINAEIADKKEQISSFRESGFEDLIREFKEYSSQYSELSSLIEDLNIKKELISSIVDKMKLKEKPNTTNFNIEYRPEIDKIIEETFTGFNSIDLLIQDVNSRMEVLLDDYKSKLNNSKWSKKYTDIKEEFNDTKNELAQKGIDDLSKLEIITKQLSNLEDNLRAIKSLEDIFATEIAKRDSIKELYFLSRKEITDQRKEFIESTISGQNNIKIDISPNRDKQNLIESIRQVLQKFTGFEDDINRFANRCLQGPDVTLNISRLAEEFVQIRKGELINTEFSGRMVNVIKGLNDEQIDELFLLTSEDDIKVKYKPNGSSEFKVLTNASAGQKTSAILTFLLSFGDVPLILDQPEDDLDNHLIYDLIVERLKKTKEKRQIIVVTHNANIPVNGDSELVLCMNSETNGIELLCDGPVEGKLVRTEICEVMEGGEGAFKLRARRYNIK